MQWMYILAHRWQRSKIEHPKGACHRLSRNQINILVALTLLLYIYFASNCLVQIKVVSADSVKVNASSSQNATENDPVGKRDVKIPTNPPVKRNDSNKTGVSLDCEPGEQRQFNYESSTRVWGSSKQQVRLRATLKIKCMEPSSNVTLKYLAEIVSLEPSFGHAAEDDGSFGGSGNSQNGKSSKLRQSIERQSQARSRLQQPVDLQSMFSNKIDLKPFAHTDDTADFVVDDNFLAVPSDTKPLAARWVEYDTRKSGIKSSKLRAEPLLDEFTDTIGQTATRVKRSVTDWFGRTWNSVKEFFVGIFQSSERSTASRDEILRETGIDIAGQCKVGSDDKHKGTKIPIDESVFEDLGPEYYIGASLDPSASTSYDINPMEPSGVPLVGQASYSGYGYNDDGDDNGDKSGGDDDDAQLSFFDDPKRGSNTLGHRRRSKRAASSSSGTGRVGKQSKQSTSYEDGSYERQLYAPFVFTQSLTGKIIDIRFASNETDLSIKNFKRHLCDLFATNLDSTTNKQQQTKPTSTNEVSPIGKHSTKYLLDTNGANSDAIKQLLMETGGADSTNAANSNDENNVKQRQFAVKVLAMVGATGLYQSRESVNGGVNNNDRGNTSNSDTNVNNNCGLSKAPTAVDGCPKVSTVLRSINATSNVRLSSKATASLSSTTSSTDPDQIQVQVKQVQKISDGRLTATAGRMVMSLTIGPAPVDEPNYDTIDDEHDDYDNSRDVDGLRIEDDVTGRSSRRRWTRQVSSLLDPPYPDSKEHAGFDVADLLAVSSAFSMQLVPAGSNSYVDTAALSVLTDQVPGKKDSSNRKRRSAEVVSKKPTITQQQASKLGTTAGTRYTSSSLLVTRPPTDANERERVLQEWRQLETRMQMTKPSQLLAEQSDSDDGSIQRLEVLRNQIKMRLNEEFVRQRVRDFRRRHQKQVAALQGNDREARQYSGGSSIVAAENGESNNATGNKFGLSLTQLILGGAITARRKGAIYDAIEETLELELSSGEENAEGSIGRLLRDTVRMDRLRSFCHSAISDYEDMTRSLQKRARIEILTPFNVSLNYSDRQDKDPLAGLNSIDDNNKRDTGKGSWSNRSVKRKRLQQCKQVLGLVLRVGEPKAADLVVELIDICNSNLLSFAARYEELGYGPMSRYYRSVRQQFIELLALYGKPSDLLLDKLMARLQFGGKHPSMDFSTEKSTTVHSRAQDNDRDFDYVPKETVTNTDTADRRKEIYNKTLLREDDHNNNDGAGSLVMTITALGNKPTVSRSKRIQIINKLLDSLKNSKCSVFDGPDLDIIESMSNFGNTAAAASGYQSKQSLPQQPIDDLVSKVVQLAKRCNGKRQANKTGGDQYIIACVHALSGQLNHTVSQRFLADQLRSAPASCTLKSEIVLTLIEAVELAELRHTTTSSWPSHGLNKVDESLLDIVVPNNNRTAVNKQDRKCLFGLIGQYFIRKQRHTPIVYQGKILTPKAMADIFGPRRRHKRGVANDNEFWDEAQCKRWSMPILEGAGSNSTDPDIADRTNDTQSIRKRHKCIASKAFGPKSAQAVLRAEVVNDLVGSRDENKFLARFRLAAQFLGNKIDIGRMYLWHQRKTTRAHANILGRSLWDTSHDCSDKPPQQMLYMPLFDFNLWLVKVSLGLRLHAEMGFQSNCGDKRRLKRLKVDSMASDPRKDRLRQATSPKSTGSDPMDDKDLGNTISGSSDDELELYPTIALRASGEASAKFVVARAGMSVASHYAYRGSIRVSRQPQSCMSIESSHQPMNLTFSSWFQLWDSDCHYWGSRHKAEPSATKWSVPARQPSVWIANECLNNGTAKFDALNRTLGGD